MKEEPYYSRDAPVRKGATCIVFPDRYEPEDGGRFFFGTIVDVFHDVVTVEVVSSTWSEWKKQEQLFFPKHQICAEIVRAKQLELF